MRAQAGHRLRHHHLLQQRHVPPVYEVRPGDFVLVTTRNPQGLRPKMQGPFKVLRVTSQGNVFVQSAPSRPGKPAPQWSVRSDRIVPYRFAHHTNVPHPSVGTASVLPPSRLPQPTSSDFFSEFYLSASAARPAFTATATESVAVTASVEPATFVMPLPVFPTVLMRVVTLS